MLKLAHDEVEEDEDHHLYHTRGWTRELWIAALGLPAVLPPPEEVKDVETAIGAARAENARDQMLQRRQASASSKHQSKLSRQRRSRDSYVPACTCRESNRDPADGKRVNIHESGEVEYWTQRFCCTPGELHHVVHAVGILAEQIESDLNNK